MQRTATEHMLVIIQQFYWVLRCFNSLNARKISIRGWLQVLLNRLFYLETFLDWRSNSHKTSLTTTQTLLILLLILKRVFPWEGVWLFFNSRWGDQCCQRIFIWNSFAGPFSADQSSKAVPIVVGHFTLEYRSLLALLKLHCIVEGAVGWLRLAIHRNLVFLRAVQIWLLQNLHLKWLELSLTLDKLICFFQFLLVTVRSFELNLVAHCLTVFLYLANDCSIPIWKVLIVKQKVLK